MTDIPTNALRQHLAKILRRVAAGESFRVTRRGRALGVLSAPNLIQRVASRPPCDPAAVRAMGPCPACPDEGRCLEIAEEKHE